MIKTITNQVIDTISYLGNNKDETSYMVKNIIKDNRITTEFIQRFREFLDKESITNSYSLTTEIMDRFPELFDEKLYKEKFSNSKSELPSLSAFIRYREFFEKIFSISEILNILRKEDITEDAALSLLGYFGNAVDELILKRTKDEDLRKNIVSKIIAEKDRYYSPVMLKYFSESEKEVILENTAGSVFFNTISSSNNYKWIDSMLDKVLNGEITITPDSSTTNSILSCMNVLPEQFITKILLIDNKKIINRNILKSALERNLYFSEKNLLKLKDVFLKNGLKFDLKKLAENNDYEELLKEIK